MPTPEVIVSKLAAFFIGLGQKCIVAAVKKWKESADRAESDELEKTIEEHEAVKPISTKIEQRITASFKFSKLTSQQLQHLLALETNPLLKDELCIQFISGSISSESIVEVFLKQDSSLEVFHSELLALASTWLDAMDKAVAESPELSRILLRLA